MSKPREGADCGRRAGDSNALRANRRVRGNWHSQGAILNYTLRQDFTLVIQYLALGITLIANVHMIDLMNEGEHYFTWYK